MMATCDVTVGHMTSLCLQAEVARDSKQSPMVQRNSSFATSHEVWKYICELGISKVMISLPRPSHDITDLTTKECSRMTDRYVNAGGSVHG